MCLAISGGELVKVACKKHGTTADQLRDWVAETPEFTALYARAREEQAHSIAEQAVEIADGAKPEDWQVAKLRSDNRKWLASKIAPRHYGEKMQQEVAGGITVKLQYVEDDE